MKRLFIPWTVLKHRNFRLLWVGLLISRTGSEMQAVAVGWHIYTLTGSALSLGLVGLARFVPLVSMALIGGLVADIADRRKLMIVSQLTMALSSGLLALLTVTNFISPPLMYFLIAVSSLAQAFDMPTRQALVPSLVPRDYLVRAISLNTLAWQTSMVIGPAIGGVVIGAFGVGAVYTFDMLSFFAIIGAAILMDPLPRLTSGRASMSLESLREGLSFVKRTPILSSAMLLDFFATFFASATLLLPIFAKDILRVGPSGLGLLYTAPALGSVSASMLLSYAGQLKKQGKILLASVIIYGFMTVFFGLSRWFPVSLLFLYLTGFADSVSMVIRHTIRQLATPDHLRGRMGSINLIFSMGGPQLGELEAGVLAAAVGAPLSVVIGGFGAVLATLLIARFIPQMQKFEVHHLGSPNS